MEDISAAIQALRSGSDEDKVKAVQALKLLAGHDDAPALLSSDSIVELILCVAQIPEAIVQELEPGTLAVLEPSRNPEGVQQLIAAYKHTDPKIAFAAVYFTVVAMDRDSIWKSMVDAGVLPGLVGLMQHSVLHCRGMAIAACLESTLIKDEERRKAISTRVCAELRKAGVVSKLMQAIREGAPQGTAEEGTPAIYRKFGYIFKANFWEATTHAILTTKDEAALACVTLYALASNDVKGVVSEILTSSDAMAVLVKAIERLEIDLKFYPLSLVRILLKVNASQDLISMLMKSGGVLATMPALIKPERPTLAIAAMNVLTLAYTETNRRPMLFPKNRMVPVRKAMVEYLMMEAGGLGSIEASILLHTMVWLEDEAIALPLSENAAELVKKLACIIQTEEPKYFWAACSLVCRHLALEAHTRALMKELMDARLCQDVARGVARLLTIPDGDAFIKRIEIWKKERHRWMVGLFQVLAHSDDAGVVEAAGGAPVVRHCIQLLKDHGLPSGMEVAALDSARKLVRVAKEAADLQSEVRRRVQDGLVAKSRRKNLVKVLEAADLLEEACTADPQLAVDLVEKTDMLKTLRIWQSSLTSKDAAKRRKLTNAILFLEKYQSATRGASTEGRAPAPAQPVRKNGKPTTAASTEGPAPATSGAFTTLMARAAFPTPEYHVFAFARRFGCEGRNV